MATQALAYDGLRSDRVRSRFERAHFGRVVPALLAEAGGGELLDLGCGDGLAAELAGERLERYVGVDLLPTSVLGESVVHDLADGLGPVGPRPFDLYLGTFGVVSHLAPAELGRLLSEIARHARPGSVVALEALGLHSFEWPSLWPTRPGTARALGYRLAAEVTVHPWAPAELARLYSKAGIEPLRALDRTLQAGPKTVPPIRAALDVLAGGSEEGWAREVLCMPLPPLPAGPAAAVHHSLAASRRALVADHPGPAADLADRIWALEPPTGGGFGHGLLLVGRVR